MSVSTWVDAPVEYGDWQKTAKQVQPSALVCCQDEFACTRLPFSWLCMANCIMEMSQHFQIKMLSLGIVFMVDKMNTVQTLFDQTL
jgi:hypothetical protein